MTEAPAGLEAVAATLRAASSVVVCAHVNPDGDAMGSVLGATLALRAAGVHAVPTLADARGVPATYAFLPGIDLFEDAASLTASDVFLALDTPSFARLGVAEQLAREAGTLVVLDHHPDSGAYGALNVVDSAAAATGQIVCRLLGHLGVRPDADMATCLYVAIVTDTGRFSYGNTDAAVLRDAAGLVEAGADPYAVYSAIYERRSMAHLRLLGLTLSRITHANGGRVAYSWITDEDLAATGTLPEETEDLIDIVRWVGDVDAVALFKVGSEGTRLSLRAKGPVDVGTAARSLGGGGHTAAAGATVDGDLDAALAAVLPLLPGGAGATGDAR